MLYLSVRKAMIANLNHFYPKILLLHNHLPSKPNSHYINNPLQMVFGTYGSTEDLLHFLNQNIFALSNTNNDVLSRRPVFLHVFEFLCHLSPRVPWYPLIGHKYLTNYVVFILGWQYEWILNIGQLAEKMQCLLEMTNYFAHHQFR